MVKEKPSADSAGQGSGTEISIKVPGVVSDLLPVLVGFVGFATITFLVSGLFSNLEWEPLGSTVADHAREVAILSGIVFSSLIGLGRIFARSLDARIMKPAQQVEKTFKPFLTSFETKFDHVSDSLERLNNSNAEFGEELRRIAIRQQNDGERIAWLEGRADKPLGSTGREA